ncbi:FadR/GntR family transcriptional regulator [Bacillus sp. 1P06AnD]|uniref:FadR/GntR family transcriptional regulator n=1 Tax=Bacillus sp. 1P06AnD TaxID=3132208 RepID=UPI0039A02961
MEKKDHKSSKVYLDIVEKLKNMIEEDGLLPGDKIPSERELSERLQAGRSSVREALRALELLGLIETRRGEGTFINDFQQHKLVEILGGFFLQDPKIKDKLTQTKHLLEMDCLRLAVKDVPKEKWDEMIQWAEESVFTDHDFFKKMAFLHNNSLMARIWTAVASYESLVSSIDPIDNKQPYLTLLAHVQKQQEQEMLQTYVELIRKKSNVY